MLVVGYQEMVPPEVYALARRDRCIRYGLDPLDRLRAPFPPRDGELLVAAGEAAQARGRLLPVNRGVGGERRGRRRVGEADPAVLSARQKLQPSYPARGPVSGSVRRGRTTPIFRACGPPTR